MSEVGEPVTGQEQQARGRPRSDEATHRILCTTHQLLEQQGFDALRMQDVAEASGCGLATIYRRWSTKPALVAAVIRHRNILDCFGNADLSALGLRDVVHALVAHMVDKRRMLPSFVNATFEHPELAEALAHNFTDEVGTHVHNLIFEATQDEAVTTYLHQALFGVVLLRHGLMGVQDLDPTDYTNEFMTMVTAFTKDGGS